MGMGKHLIEAVTREHRNKPIAGDVLLIGRQTTYIRPRRCSCQYESTALP